MKRVLSGVLSLAMASTLAVAGCPVASAEGVSATGGFGYQGAEVVVHTPEEFIEALTDESLEYQTEVYVANDLDFSDYGEVDPIYLDAVVSIIGYDEETGQNVQRTISNVEYTADGLPGYDEQSYLSGGLIYTWGGIDNITFENLTANIVSDYERDNADGMYPQFNVLSTCGYGDVYVYDLTVNATGYFDRVNVLGNAWNLYQENDIIVDGVTVNGGDINLLNVLSEYASKIENVDVRNVEVNADNLDWFQTVSNTVGSSLSNVTVSNVTINDDIDGFGGISWNVPVDANNIAVQDVYINGTAEYVNSIAYTYDDTTLSNFLVRNVNVEGLTGEALFGGICNSVYWGGADSQEDMAANKGVTYGYIDVQSPYLGGVLYGGLFNGTSYDATGMLTVTGDNVFYTTDTPLVGTNPEYANLENFNATKVDGSSVDEVYDALKGQSNAWTVRDDGVTPVLDILPWYEIPSDSLALKLLRIKKYAFGLSTEYDESLDVNGDGVINVIDYLSVMRELLGSESE